MQPGESSSRPTPDRTPLPRHRIAVDGVSAGQRSPVFGDAQRQAFTRRIPVTRPAETAATPLPASQESPSMAARTLDFVASQPVQPQSQPEFQPVAQPQPEPQPEPQPPVPPKLDFTPPPPVKKPRRFFKLRRQDTDKLPVSRSGFKKALKIVGLMVLVLAVGSGLYGFIHWQAMRNNPDKVFQDALHASLSTQQITSQASDGKLSSTVNHDFSVLQNPIISSQSTISLAGSIFNVNAFGTAKNTYISYTGLPSTVDAHLAAVVKNNWVQLRLNGKQPAGVSANLANLADPRYQSIGPVVFGNLPVKIQTQILTYVAANHVYKYDAKQVAHTTVGSTKVLAYTVTLNTVALKVINQSAALSEGFSPEDVLAATNALANLKGASTTFSVDSKTHRFLQVVITQNGQTTTISYSDYNQGTLPNEPVTQLGWAKFSPEQYLLESQAASHQTAAQRDAARQAQLTQLHGVLASYFEQNNNYPSFANINDQTWVATNLPGLDPELLRDPQGTSLTLASAAKAGSFAYQPQAYGGKGVCDNAGSNPCTRYKLISLLSNNQPYIVQDP